MQTLARAQRNGLPAAVAFLACLLTGVGVAAFGADRFAWDGKRLVVRNGAVTFTVADGVCGGWPRGDGAASGQPAAAGPVVPAGLPWGACVKNNWGEFSGRWAKGEEVATTAGSWVQPPAGAGWEFSRISKTVGELVLQNAAGTPAGGLFRYRVACGPEKDEVVIEATATVPGTAVQGWSLPLVGLTGESVVLGNGVEHRRAEPRSLDRCVREANNLYSPAFAVVCGKEGCLAVWPESVTDVCDIVLVHAPGADHLVLESRTVLPVAPGGTVTSVRWRIGWYPDWVTAVRRYRAWFEQAMGAVPLWKQAPAWVRDVHAVCTEMPAAEKAEAFYAELADQIDPRKLLLFYWNGSFLLAFGDHRHGIKSARPGPAVVAAFARRGFRWLGYHPYNMIFSPKGLATRLAEWRATGELPPDYTFQPDWGGAAAEFAAFFKPFAAGYYKPLEEADVWVLHPGATEVRDYLARNLGGYCAAHRMDGAYLDILGADHTYHYPPERKVMAGNSYRVGEGLAVRAMHERNPTLAVMSECESAWTVAGTFYTWEGASHVHLPNRHPGIGIPLPNHPLRTALWGSYCWTREQELDSADAALLGCLPELIPGDPWSTARAKLFAAEELYPDVPSGAWPTGAKAVYRGRKGRWFQFRELPWGDGYVESAGRSTKLLLGRFRNQNTSPLPEPVSIPGWSAYADGRPIGLNPAQIYKFLPAPPATAGPFSITALPAGSWVQAVRQAKGWSVVELGTGAAAVGEGEVTFRFGRDCAAIADAAREWRGPFAAGQSVTVRTRLPGGLVCRWETADAVDGRFRTDFLTVRGRVLARGVADERYSSNCLSSLRNDTRDGRNLPTLVLAPGRFRGYAEQWIRLADSATPVLKFEVRLPAAEGRKDARLVAAVAVNGREIWREPIAASADWVARELPLQAYIGRTVLVTFSAIADSATDTFPEPGDSPLLFSRVRVDNNPEPLPDWLDRLVPAPPAEVLFRDSFAAPPAENGWRVEISPAQPAAKLDVRDGRLGFTGEHYKYLYVARSLPAGDLSAQVRLQVSRSGCMPAWNPGLALYWNRDAYAFLAVGGFKGGDEVAVIRGAGTRATRLTGMRLRVLDDNSYDVWLRIVLRADKLEYAVSVDGRNWQPVATAPRPSAGAGAAPALLLGRGMTGGGDEFRNDERWPTSLGSTYAGEVIVGRPGP